MKNKAGYAQYKAKLQGEYFEEFEKIEVYFKACELEVDVLEENLNDILDLFLSAQNDNKGVSKLIGSNTEKFCKEFIESASPYFIVRSLILGIMGMSLVGLIYSICSIVMAVINGDSNVLTYKLQISDYFGGVILGVFGSIVINFIGKRVMFKIKKFSVKKYKVVSTFVFIIFSAIVIGIMELANICMNIERGQLFGASIGLIITSIVMFGIYYKITGGLGSSKDSKKSFDERTLSLLVNNMINKFNSENAKREKAGLTSYTKEEWMDKMKKENIRYKKISIFSVFILFIYFVSSFISIAISSKLIDTLIFALIEIIVCGPIIFLILKGISTRFELMKRIHISGKTIFDEDILE